MKIKKILALLMVVTAFSTAFTGCSDEEKEEKKSASDSSAEESYESEDDSSSDNDSSGSIFNNSSNESEDTLAEQLLNSESAYVDLVYGKFFSHGGRYFSDGTKYERWQDDDEYWTDDVDLEFFNEIGLLYFNNGEFEQYTHEYYNYYSTDTIVNYKGNYDIGENDQLILEYQQEEYTEDDETIYYDLNSGRLADSMIEANEGQYLLGINGLYHAADEINWGDSFLSGDCYYINPSGEYQSYGFSIMEQRDVYTQFYFKNNYIVADQYGYSFKNYVSRSEFTLECEFTLEDMEQYASSDEIEYLNAMGYLGLTHIIMKFYDDNSFICTDADTGEQVYSSNWQLYDDNLLIINPGENLEYIYIDNTYFLYLDFENEEIYVPAFCRCDEFIEVKEKFESYYEDEF